METHFSGSRAPIRSWIQSLVIDESAKSETSLLGDADVNSEQMSQRVVEAYNEKIFW